MVPLIVQWFNITPEPDWPRHQSCQRTSHSTSKLRRLVPHGSKVYCVDHRGALASPPFTEVEDLHHQSGAPVSEPINEVPPPLPPINEVPPLRHQSQRCPTFTATHRGAPPSPPFTGASTFITIHRGAPTFTTNHRGATYFTTNHRGTTNFTTTHRGAPTPPPITEPPLITEVPYLHCQSQVPKLHHHLRGATNFTIQRHLHCHPLSFTEVPYLHHQSQRCH